ncbi:hypothetical protein SLA2020_494220 [Shorea laevis]
MRITPMTLHAPQIRHIHVHGYRQSGVLVCGFWDEKFMDNTEAEEHSSVLSRYHCYSLSKNTVKGTSRGPVLDPTNPLGHRRLDLIGQAHAKCVT